MSWSTSELRVRLAPLNRFKPSSKIFYWPFQGGTSFVDLLCLCSVLCLLCFVFVCLYVLCGHLLGKGWPLGSRLWCLLWVCHFPIGFLGQVWYLIVSIPDLRSLTYLVLAHVTMKYFHDDVCLLDLNLSLNIAYFIIMDFQWNEPVHEITNNVVYATSKASDKPAHTRSLIRAFACRLNILWLFSYWLNTIWSF